ncbi:MAG: ribonuclease P protein component [Microgenomates group bacterium]
MFPKQVKLSLKNQNGLFLSAKKKHSSLFTMLYQESENPGLAVIVSKKISLKAVIRNLIKRRVFAALTSRATIILEKKYAIVVRCKPAIVLATYREIEHQLQHTFDEIFSTL